MTLEELEDQNADLIMDLCYAKAILSDLALDPNVRPKLSPKACRFIGMDYAPYGYDNNGISRQAPDDDAPYGYADAGLGSYRIQPSFWTRVWNWITWSAR